MNTNEKIPVDLDDAVSILISGQTPEVLEKIAKMSNDEFWSNGLHMTMGMGLRNSWGLWFNETQISKWFTTIDVYHGDDRSAIILNSFWRQVAGLPRDLETQLEVYKKHWKEAGFKDGIYKQN